MVKALGPTCCNQVLGAAALKPSKDLVALQLNETSLN